MFFGINKHHYDISDSLLTTLLFSATDFVWYKSKKTESLFVFQSDTILHWDVITLLS